MCDQKAAKSSARRKMHRSARINSYIYICKYVNTRGNSEREGQRETEKKKERERMKLKIALAYTVKGKKKDEKETKSRRLLPSSMVSILFSREFLV